MGNKQQTQLTTTPQLTTQIAPSSKVVTFGQTKPQTQSQTYTPPTNVNYNTPLKTAQVATLNNNPINPYIPPQLAIINKNHDIWAKDHNYINKLYVNQNDTYYENQWVQYPNNNNSGGISNAQRQVPNGVQQVLTTNQQISKPDQLSKTDNQIIPYQSYKQYWEDLSDDEEQQQVKPKQNSRRKKPKNQTVDTKTGDTIGIQQPRQKQQPRQPQQSQQPQQPQQPQQQPQQQPLQPPQQQPLQPPQQPQPRQQQTKQTQPQPPQQQPQLQQPHQPPQPRQKQRQNNKGNKKGQSNQIVNSSNQQPVIQQTGQYSLLFPNS